MKLLLQFECLVLGLGHAHELGLAGLLTSSLRRSIPTASLFHLYLLLYAHLFFHLFRPLHFLLLHFRCHHLILIIRVDVSELLCHPTQLLVVLHVASATRSLPHQLHLAPQYLLISLRVIAHAHQIIEIEFVGLLPLVQGRRQLLGQHSAVEDSFHQQVLVFAHLVVDVLEDGGVLLGEDLVNFGDTMI